MNEHDYPPVTTTVDMTGPPEAPDTPEAPDATEHEASPERADATHHTPNFAPDSADHAPDLAEQPEVAGAIGEAEAVEPPEHVGPIGGHALEDAGGPSGGDPGGAEAPASGSIVANDAQGDAPASDEHAIDPGPPTLPRLDRLPRPQETRQIALINQKGGVGKTTTTVNLGAALAASGLRVLMIDLDPQAHLTLSVGIDPEELDLSVYELLTDSTVTASEVVRMVEGCPNLGVLPAVTNLAGVESEMSEMIATGLAQTVLRNKTADLVKQFDYVLLDCPPSLGLLTINGLTAAKEIIVPMQAHFLALQGMGKLFETINMIRQGINPALTVAGVVLCMHEANTILASDVVADVEGFFESARGTALPWANAEVYQPPVRRNIKLAEAPSFGQSVLTYAPDSNGAKDYAKLAHSVAKAAV